MTRTPEQEERCVLFFACMYLILYLNSMRIIIIKRLIYFRFTHIVLRMGNRSLIDLEPGSFAISGVMLGMLETIITNNIAALIV